MKKVLMNMMLEPYFTEDHVQMRKIMRDFVEKEIKPNVEKWEDDGIFAKDLYKRMAEANLLGIQYPEEVGGQGGDYFMGMILAEELARSGCGGVPMAVGVQTDMATPPIFKFGTPEQHEKYLKPALQGEKIAAIGITEPNHGSDVQSIQTRAERVDDGWVINGTKTFITNGTRADFITLVTRTSDEPGARGISLFIVDTDLPGFSVSKPFEKVGMRSSDTAEIMFDNVKVPQENLLGVEGKGFYQIMWQLQGERLNGAASSIGMAQYTYELALGYAQNRMAFEQPVSNFQVISHLLAEMKTEIEVCRELTYAAAYKFGKGEVSAKDISMAKLASVQMAHWVADRALQIFGGNGYMEEYPIARLWRDSRLPRIGGGTDEIMKEIIAGQMEL